MKYGIEFPTRVDLGSGTLINYGDFVQFPKVFWPGGFGWLSLTVDMTGSPFIQVTWSPTTFSYAENVVIPGLGALAATGVYEFSAPRGFIVLGPSIQEGEAVNLVNAYAYIIE